MAEWAAAKFRPPAPPPPPPPAATPLGGALRGFDARSGVALVGGAPAGDGSSDSDSTGGSSSGAGGNGDGAARRRLAAASAGADGGRDEAAKLHAAAVAGEIKRWAAAWRARQQQSSGSGAGGRWLTAADAGWAAAPSPPPPPSSPAPAATSGAGGAGGAGGSPGVDRAAFPTLYVVNTHLVRRPLAMERDARAAAAAANACCSHRPLPHSKPPSSTPANNHSKNHPKHHTTPHQRPLQGDDEFPSFYASGDAFVLPSRGEGWGRPHVEAMSMSLPVIATNWSGVTAFLDDSVGYPLPIEGLVPAEGDWSMVRPGRPRLLPRPAALACSLPARLLLQLLHAQHPLCCISQPHHDNNTLSYMLATTARPALGATVGARAARADAARVRGALRGGGKGRGGARAHGRALLAAGDRSGAARRARARRGAAAAVRRRRRRRGGRRARGGLEAGAFWTAAGVDCENVCLSLSFHPVYCLLL